MTNAVIMHNTRAALGIPLDAPLYTFAEWKKRGYIVKRGEHGLKVMLWKRIDEKEHTDEKTGKTTITISADGPSFKLRPCFLFMESQVTPA